MRTVLISSLCFLFVFFTSCEFSETLVLNPDGSGEMRIQMDASDMIAMMSAMGGQDEMKGMDEKIDTTFFFRDFLAENRDSIASLPLEQQAKLKKLEPYGVHINMDANDEKLVYDVFISFNSISEANNMFDVFNQISNTGINSASATESSVTQESIKVNYTFENNIFKRDAYITDKALHQRELDSLKSMEMMLSGTMYKLNYSFPKKIKSSSQPDATFSSDRKTLYFQTEYLEYLKNPNLLNIEVILEN